jgi:Ca2+/Na+ antiporter
MNNIITYILLTVVLAIGLVAVLSPLTMIKIQLKLFNSLLPYSSQDNNIYFNNTDLIRLSRKDPQKYKVTHKRHIQLIRLSGMGFLCIYIIGLWVVDVLP